MVVFSIITNQGAVARVTGPVTLHMSTRLCCNGQQDYVAMDLSCIIINPVSTVRGC